MGFFKDIATPLSQRNIPVVPLRPRTKIAFLPNWETLATTDINQIDEWDRTYIDANCGSVAKAVSGGIWLFEFDAPEVAQRVFVDTQQKLPDTFKVRSSIGKGHVYFRQNPASIAMGNLPQGFVKHGDWSARVDSQYCVSPGSLHPKTGLPYEIRSTADIVEAPDWFIDWCLSQRIEKAKPEEAPRDGNNLIPHGYIHDQLVSQCGKFANMGMPPGEALEDALLAWAHANCAPPLDEDHVRQVARSTDGWKRGNPASEIVLVGGKIAGSTVQNSQVQIISPEEAEDIIQIKPVSYPKFPEWVMYGTSIYEGLVKPFCDENARYPAMMWMPAMAILLNYLGTKVRIERKNLIPSIFMVLIGRRGKVIKSSSVEDAIRYFEYAGVVGHNEQSLNNANGRSLVFTPASPEGLGKEMQRVNCRNGILFYDELKNLTDKSSIESSTLSTTLLTMYESGKYQNIVKNPKDSFSFLPGTYCASLIACSTDKNFNANWSKLAGKSTGLNDRFTFVLPPEVLKPLTPYCHVSTQEGSIKTRQLIDKALQKGVYRIIDSSPLSKFTAENEDANRAEIRAEKYALGLAVDIGLDELDEEVIERALALVAYEQSVKAYLKTYEASTREGAIQLEVMYQLRKSGGRMSLRDLYRVIHPERLGTSLWATSYSGLIKSGWCAEQGGGVKGAPKELILLRMPEEDDD